MYQSVFTYITLTVPVDFFVGSVKEYYDAMVQFMSLVPQLLFQGMDEDLRLREQAVLVRLYMYCSTLLLKSVI